MPSVFAVGLGIISWRIMGRWAWGRKVTRRAGILFSCTHPVSLASHGSFFLELRVKCFLCPYTCSGKVSGVATAHYHSVGTDNSLSVTRCVEKPQRLWRPLHYRPQRLPGEDSFLLLPSPVRRDKMASTCLSLFRRASCQFLESQSS